MFERFTEQTRQVVVHALQRAQDLGSGTVRAEHLLLALVEGPEAAVLTGAGVDPARLAEHVRGLGTLAGDGAALQALGIDLDQVRRRAEAAFGAGALERRAPRRRRLLPRLGGGALPFDASAKRALEQAVRQAAARRDDRLSPAHLLLGLLADDHDPAGTALQAVGVAPETVRTAARAALSRAA